MRALTVIALGTAVVDRMAVTARAGDTAVKAAARAMAASAHQLQRTLAPYMDPHVLHRLHHCYNLRTQAWCSLLYRRRGHDGLKTGS